jgi:hypothetical protein
MLNFKAIHRMVKSCGCANELIDHDTSSLAGTNGNFTEQDKFIREKAQTCDVSFYLTNPVQSHPSETLPFLKCFSCFHKRRDSQVKWA